MIEFDIGAIVAVVGLGNLLAFGQTQKHLSMNKWSVLFGVLTIPMAISLLWRIALNLGWWSIALFVGLSLIVGICTAMASRAFGTVPIYSLQTTEGTMAAICSIGCWFF